MGVIGPTHAKNPKKTIEQCTKIFIYRDLKLKSSFTKVMRIIPQKNHSNSTRSPVQTQKTVYELSRSRKNGVSFKEKAKGKNYKE